MGMVAPLQRIASAFFVLLGRRGDITRAAQQRGVPRQTLYRESQRVVAAVGGESHQAEVMRLRQRIADLEAERASAQAEAQKRQLLTVTIDRDKQAEFASVGQAEGVSLPVLRTLLEVLLGDAGPSVAKLGRLTRAASERAGEVLSVLDEASRPLVRQGLADEIFVGRQPVLMVVEPDSLCWVNGRLAPSREGTEWASEFRQLPGLAQVTCDRGSGLRNGIKQINGERRAAGQALLAEQADHFHLCYAAARALRLQKNETARAIKKAEAAQQRLASRQWHGQKCVGRAGQVTRYWRQAEQAMDRWSGSERAWHRLREGLALFTPTGELNRRERVQALIAEVEPELTGAAWAKVKRQLAAPELCTFLDRAHEQLAALPMEPAVREALIEAEGLRRRPELTQGEGTKPATLRGTLLVTGVLMSLLGSTGQAAVEAVRKVFRHTWRASSLVEGVNSVLRMQQARHRRLTPEMLNLKRLYWNCRALRTGRRRQQSPYQRLGLVMPELRWWQMLKLPPEQLRQELSALRKTE